jgi:tripartite-type tricarboxylate transporter receptor subunit TctC
MKTRIRYRLATALAGCACLGLVSTVSAQSFPAKPVRVVIHFPPGGPVDLVSRALSSLVVINPQILVVHPSLPVKTVPDLIRLARSKPGQIDYASVGPGSPNHMGMELLKSMAKIDMVHIPYKGTAPAMADVMSGQVSLLFNSMPAVLSQIATGRLRAIAVGSARRSPAAPDIPTVAETPGLEGFQYTTWYALLAHAATPKDVISKVNADTVRILNDPEMVKFLSGQGAEPSPTTPEGLAKHMRMEYEGWRKVIREAGIKLQ